MDDMTAGSPKRLKLLVSDVWWSGAGVGVGMLRGKGVLSFLGSKFLGFLFLKFHGPDFRLLGTKVVWFIGLKVSKIYQISISCFQEGIDLVSKISEILLDGSSGLFGARLFSSLQNCGFSTF